MTIYLLNIFILIAYGFLIKISKGLLYSSTANYGALVFCVLASFNWILISGLRHVSVGDDTLAYQDWYEDTYYSTWQGIFDFFVGVYSGAVDGKDPGYDVFVKITQFFFSDYNAYLFLVAVIITGLMARWIYRYSSDVLLSFLIYSVLFFAFFALTGIRQSIAAALIVFLGYDLIVKRKLWWFLVLAIVASTIHKSAIIFTIFYFIHQIRLSRSQYIYVMLVLPVLFLFKDPLSAFFKSIAGLEEYGVYEEAGTYNFTVLMLLIGAVVLWRYDKIIKNSPLSFSLINAYLLSMFFLPLTFVNPSAMRVVMYFSVFLMLLIPEIIRTFGRRDRLVAYFSIVAVLIFMFIRANSERSYLFFWQ